MTTLPQHENSKAAALWRAGRNLLCFQQIEAMLKSLLPAAQGAGTIAQIEAQIREGQRKVSKASLGALASQYEHRVLSGPRPAFDPVVGKEILFSFSSSIDAPLETLKEMRSQWRRLVKERNRLVHSTLIAYDLKSREGCNALSQHLDEQYDRARQLLDRLVHHQKSRAMAASVLKQLLESGHLHKLDFSPQNDA